MLELPEIVTGGLRWRGRHRWSRSTGLASSVGLAAPPATTSRISRPRTKPPRTLQQLPRNPRPRNSRAGSPAISALREPRPPASSAPAERTPLRRRDPLGLAETNILANPYITAGAQADRKHLGSAVSANNSIKHSRKSKGNRNGRNAPHHDHRRADRWEESSAPSETMPRRRQDAPRALCQKVNKWDIGRERVPGAQSFLAWAALER